MWKARSQFHRFKAPQKEITELSNMECKDIAIVTMIEGKRSR